MSDPITINADGTRVQVWLEIPGHLTGGKSRSIYFQADLGGEPAAVQALVHEMQRGIRAKLERIRRLAYEQGAKDRAKKATEFYGGWAEAWRAGCYYGVDK